MAEKLAERKARLAGVKSNKGSSNSNPDEVIRQFRELGRMGSKVKVEKSNGD